MFENLTFSYSQPQFKSQQPIRLFWRMFMNGWFHRAWAFLRRRASRLRELSQDLGFSGLKSSYYAGIRSVSIDKIRGTEGKANAFDDAFNPMQENSRDRWLNVAREKLRGHFLPPVELIDLDGTYYVRDGHHRISVARSLGETYIDAEVVVMNLNRRIRWQDPSFGR
jgi:hypothetical protein